MNLIFALLLCDDDDDDDDFSNTMYRQTGTCDLYLVRALGGTLRERALGGTLRGDRDVASCKALM